MSDLKNLTEAEIVEAIQIGLDLLGDINSLTAIDEFSEMGYEEKRDRLKELARKGGIPAPK